LFQSQPKHWESSINEDGINFLSDLERHITQSTDDHHESGFRFQRLSVLIEHYNAVAVTGTFTHTIPVLA